MARKQFSNSDICHPEQAADPAPRAGSLRCGTPRAGHRPCLLAIAVGCVALAGCSSAPKQAYPETFKDTNTYSRSYQASDAATCEAARRALLSQGYTIGKAQTDGVEGQKNFQIQDEDKQHQVISFHVVCTSDKQASPHTTVFVNAVQDRYIVKKTGSSAGVGLSVLGSVSMPFGSYDDSLAKISSETISAPAFYDGFFDLLQRYLPQSKPTEGAESKAPDGAAPKVPDGTAPKAPDGAKPASMPTPSPSPSSSSSSPSPSPSSSPSPVAAPAPSSAPSSPPAASPPSTSNDSPAASPTPATAPDSGSSGTNPNPSPP